MSCRHDLALGTCKACYPESGTIEPEGDGDSLDGSGAVIQPSRIYADADAARRGLSFDVASVREQKLQDENQALRDQIQLLESEKKNRDHALRQYIESLEKQLADFFSADELE